MHIIGVAEIEVQKNMNGVYIHVYSLWRSHFHLPSHLGHLADAFIQSGILSFDIWQEKTQWPIITLPPQNHLVYSLQETCAFHLHLHLGHLADAFIQSDLQ